MSDDFPRVEVTGDQEGGWLAEIHDGMFHRVFTSLTGTYEEVKKAAMEAFVSLHPESVLAKPAAPAEPTPGADKNEAQAQLAREEQQQDKAATEAAATTDSGAVKIGGGAIIF